jgi:hypothetical protein
VYPILAIHAKALSFRYCCVGDFVVRLRDRDIAFLMVSAARCSWAVDRVVAVLRTTSANCSLRRLLPRKQIQKQSRHDN